MAKTPNAGLYVVGKLMAVEEITAKSGRVLKRLVVYFGDAKNLIVLAPRDAHLPPEGSSVTLPIRSISVTNQGGLTALLMVDNETEGGVST